MRITRSRRGLCLAVALQVGLFVGCTPAGVDPEPGADSGAAPTATRVVWASNYPLTYFAERLAPPATEVRTVPGTVVDPAYWKPTADDIVGLQQADLIVLNGASYESWLGSVSLPMSRTVDTTSALQAELLPVEGEITHSHGLEGEHAHAGTAFTTWMDPTVAARQAAALAGALADKWPESAAQVESASAQLAQDLDAVDQALEAALGNAAGLRVVFSHPVYQYFQRRYGIDGESVHWEPDVMPDEAMWAELAELLARHPAGWMLWEAQPLPEIVERLEGLGVRSAVLATGAKQPESGDFMELMQRNLETISQITGSTR